MQIEPVALRLISQLSSSLLEQNKSKLLPLRRVVSANTYNYNKVLFPHRLMTEHIRLWHLGK